MQPDREPDRSEAANPEQELRDIAEVPAVEVVTTVAVHLMSAAAVKCGLADEPAGEDHLDLAEARILIEGLAGLIGATAPWLGNAHAAPLRDGLASLQAAFAEASDVPDPAGSEPGAKLGRRSAADL